MNFFRGRPKKKADSDEEDMPAKKNGVYVPTGKPRGCPPGGWPEKPKKGPYVPTGKPRGCPPGGWPEKPKVPSTYVPNGKPRGRPPKNKVVEDGGELN